MHLHPGMALIISLVGATSWYTKHVGSFDTLPGRNYAVKDDQDRYQFQVRRGRSLTRTHTTSRPTDQVFLCRWCMTVTT